MYSKCENNKSQIIFYHLSFFFAPPHFPKQDAKLPITCSFFRGLQSNSSFRFMTLRTNYRTSWTFENTGAISVFLESTSTRGKRGKRVFYIYIFSCDATCFLKQKQQQRDVQKFLLLLRQKESVIISPATCLIYIRARTPFFPYLL